MTSFSSTSRTVTRITSIVGGAILVGAAATTVAVQAFAAPLGGDDTQTAPTGGVTSIDVDSNASAFTLEFADVDEATLDIVGQSRARWSLETRGDTLVVESDQRFWDFCIGWCAAGGERVTLTLPESMSDGTLDTDLSVGAGSVTAGGDFRSLDLRVGAGSLTFDGAAAVLTAEIDAGRADITVDGARDATFDVSAGRTDAVLTGAAPRSVDLDVSAGRLALELPNEVYAVHSEVSAGSLDNRLQTSSTAQRVISADVSAGSATLAPGRQ